MRPLPALVGPKLFAAEVGAGSSLEDPVETLGARGWPVTLVRGALADDRRGIRELFGGEDSLLGQVAGMWAMGQTLPIRALQSVSAGAAGFAADAYENAPEWIESKPNYQLDGGLPLLDGIGDQIAAAREEDDAECQREYCW